MKHDKLFFIILPYLFLPVIVLLALMYVSSYERHMDADLDLYKADYVYACQDEFSEIMDNARFYGMCPDIKVSDLPPKDAVNYGKFMFSKYRNTEVTSQYWINGAIKYCDSDGNMKGYVCPLVREGRWPDAFCCGFAVFDFTCANPYVGFVKCDSISGDLAEFDCRFDDETLGYSLIICDNGVAGYRFESSDFCKSDDMNVYAGGAYVRAVLWYVSDKNERQKQEWEKKGVVFID